MERQVMLRGRQKTCRLLENHSLAHGSHLNVKLIEVGQSRVLLMHGRMLDRGSLQVLPWSHWKRCLEFLGDLEGTGVKLFGGRRSGIIQSVTIPRRSRFTRNWYLKNESVTHVLAKLPQGTLHSFDALDQAVTVSRSRPCVVINLIMSST